MESESVDISDDAEQFFLSETDRPAWKETRRGFLVEGAELIGKTRLVGEWIKAHRRGRMVLVPHSQVSHPLRLPNRSRLKRCGVVFFLDDINASYVDSIASILKAVDDLADGDVLVEVWATARTVESLALETTRAFSALLQYLDIVTLNRPDAGQNEELASALQLDAPATEAWDGTFSWTLEQEFKERRNLYNKNLSNEARCLLQAGRLLDACGISISWRRWVATAISVLNLPPGTEVNALAELNDRHFLTPDRLPEIAYLSQVVNGTFNPADYELALREFLKQTKDAEGLFEWGLKLTMQSLEYIKAAELFQDVVNQSSDDVLTAKALSAKGIVLKEMGNFEEAICAHDEVVWRFGELTRLDIAERVVLALANKARLLEQLGYLRESIAVENEIMDRFGERYETEVAMWVASVLVNKGLQLKELGDLSAALSTYDEVVLRFGERSEMSMMERVAMALANKGHLLIETRDPLGALLVYTDVVRRYGNRKEPEIAVWVASALASKGAQLMSLKDSRHAIITFEDLIARLDSYQEPLIRKFVAIARQALTELDQSSDDSPPAPNP